MYEEEFPEDVCIRALDKTPGHEQPPYDPIRFLSSPYSIDRDICGRMLNTGKLALGDSGKSFTIN